ncbi:MAG: AmmeMemoRadiSam system protein B [Phycisphaerales bacterium JB061]
MDQPSMPTFDASMPQQERPKLRPIRGFVAPAQGPDGKQVQLLGLADAKQISPKVVMTQPAMQAVLPLFNGEHTLDDIVTQVGRGLTREHLEPFVAQLYDAGLIEGAVFDEMWAKMRADFDSTDILPPAQTAAMADAIVEAHTQKDHGRAATDEEKAEQGKEKLAEQMTAMMNQALEKAEDPSFDKLPKAIIAPYVPYQQGFLMYGAVYGRMRVVDKPARIVVLGTNHFGEATGVCACDKGFRTPLGESPADADMIKIMREKLGEQLFEHRYDHEREHSIELQVAWLQHVFGDENGTNPPVFAALVHDPVVNNGDSYDGKGVAFQPFVDALKEAIAGLPGPTLLVGSAELSHVGPAYGDKVQLAGDAPEVEANRRKVIEQDQALMKMLTDNKPQDLVSSLAWQQNPTRWSSVGAIAATMLAADPNEVRLLQYGGTMDPQGTAMISAASLAMF